MEVKGAMAAEIWIFACLVGHISEAGLCVATGRQRSALGALSARGRNPKNGNHQSNVLSLPC